MKVENVNENKININATASGAIMQCKNCGNNNMNTTARGAICSMKNCGNNIITARGAFSGFDSCRGELYHSRLGIKWFCKLWINIQSCLQWK